MAVLLVVGPGGAVALGNTSAPQREQPIAHAPSFAASSLILPVVASAPPVEASDHPLEHEQPSDQASVRPVGRYRVSSTFGLRRMPWERVARLHRGLDLAAPAGTAVRTIGAGVVVSAGWRGGYGLSVQVRHPNGLTSSYSHLRSISVEAYKGVRLTAGEQLGEVGSTGSSTGPHLHFEVRDSRGVAIDPAPFLKGSTAPNLTKPYLARKDLGDQRAERPRAARVILTQEPGRVASINVVTVRGERRERSVQLTGSGGRKRPAEVIAFGPPNTVTIRGR